MRAQVRPFCFLLLLSLTIFTVRLGAQKDDVKTDLLREKGHQDPQWQIVQPHLPDPMTASAEQLQTAADVLRARRFPVDALEDYGYALQHTRYPSPLLNKIRVT